MVRIYINDRPIEAHAGQTVLQAASQAGIVIPTLCHHPDLSPVGSCRLCLVELSGRIGETAACKLPAIDGMVIHTETPAVVQARQFVLRLLLDQVQLDPLLAGESNELVHWVRHYGIPIPSEPAQARRFPVAADSSPVIRVDLNQCIMCTRCVRACWEVQGCLVWNVASRGHESHVVAGTGTTMLEAGCESCGLCADVCPTGALVDRNAFGQPPPEKLVTTTCAYCGVGCQFDLNVRDGRVERVTSNPAAPVNGLSLCVKGRYGFDYLHHPDRLPRPRVRRYLLEQTAKPADRGSAGWQWAEVSWDAALELAVRRLAAVRKESGPDALAFLSSAKCTNEENYLLQKLARQVVGTHNVDHCARLCHSPTVAGLTMAYGSGAMSNSMDDVAEHAAAMLIIGSNTTEQHPVFGTMIRQAVLKRGMKLVVADPRRIDITQFATLHLRQRPGTDTALVNGLMHVIVNRGWHDRAFIAARCEGFDPFAASLGEYTPQRVAQITGVPERDLIAAAELLSRNKPLAVVWAMGITQHINGVGNVLSLANLQMLLGNLGIPGGGVNPLRGQNNVQGASDMGALPNVYAGYQLVSDAAVAAKFASAWAVTDKAGGAREQTCSTVPGLTITEIIDAAGKGQIRALYILGEDPAMTEPDSNYVRVCLTNADFFVLQEIFPSETSEYADVLLPGAAFAEKDGTFTNTERRVQLVRKAIEPPGEARADWEVIAKLARRLLAAQDLRPAGCCAGWDYAHPSQIMAEVAAVTPSYAGVSHERLARGERLQWPVPAADRPGTPILHVGQFTRGHGKFHIVEHLPAAELPDGKYPLLLTTGRVLYHWHGGELSRRSQPLAAIYPETLVEINPQDARRIGLNGRQHVRVVSRRGEMLARAQVTERVAPGVVFGNFHFPAERNVNNVTHAAVDPVAKIPEYKVCAVRIEALDEPHKLRA
jgi:formate dehydrogenase alpha subunit